MIESTSLSLPSNSSTISCTNFPSQFHMHFYFYNSLNPPSAGLYVLGCRTIFWSMGGLLASFLKKTYPPSQTAVNCQWFFSKGWDFMNICWHFVCAGPYTHRHSYFEFMCLMALSFPVSSALAVDFHYLWLLLSSHSLFCDGP